ncbi:MAG: tRNA pseudouridine(55) synthase TruB [Actinomycetota bacterium]
MIDGLVVVDKEPGWTSHDVVAKLRGVFGQRRVGHAGTLDPAATGVLLVGLGRVTRLLRYLQETTKSYTGRVVFGVGTDSLDADGVEVARVEMALTREAVELASTSFVGALEQVPPMVSALKVGGRRLHALAREGIEVERAPRAVRIDSITVDDFVPGSFPEATISVTCSSGTYIRSLAADLGAHLGGPAHLAALRRTAVGSFTLAEARSLGVIAGNPAAAVVGPAAALRDLDRLTADRATAGAIGHGARFPVDALGASGDGPFAVVDEGGALLAVYERRGEGLKPTVVLATEVTG